MWQRNNQTHLMYWAWHLVSLVRGHSMSEKGHGRTYKLRSTMKMRDLLFTISHTSIGEHWTKSVCIQISKERGFMLVLLSYATHSYRMLWMPEFYSGLEVIRQIKGKGKGGLLNVIPHRRLGEHSKQCYFFPALLLYCSLGSCSWAATRSRTATERNFSLTTTKKKEKEKNCTG